MATPRIASDFDDEDKTLGGDFDSRDWQEWEAEQKRLDRDWYNSEEFGVSRLIVCLSIAYLCIVSNCTGQRGNVESVW
jgi:hypothetical protein